VEERRNVLSVPLEAVDRSGPAASVYAVISPGVIHISPVTLGLESDQRVEVRSGLQEGDVVVVGRHAGLKEGQPVQKAEAH
jgi:multidrug efflux pump subunit AcrA (membrane-fusion protein)